MIDEETKRYRNTKNYLEYLGNEDVHQFEVSQAFESLDLFALQG